MVELVGVHGMDDTEVICDLLEVGDGVRHPHARLADTRPLAGDPRSFGTPLVNANSLPSRNSLGQGSLVRLTNSGL